MSIIRNLFKLKPKRTKQYIVRGGNNKFFRSFKSKSPLFRDSESVYNDAWWVDSPDRAKKFKNLTTANRIANAYFGEVILYV